MRALVVFGRACALMLAVTLALLCAAAALADEAPQLLVRAHLEPAGPVVAGSEVKLVVDCLTTTWFTEAPDWPLFEVPGAIVSLPDEQAENLGETIDGVKWFGVRRAYRIVPQTAKTFDIPSFAITVQPGQMNGPAKLMTPALKLVATVPAGAEGMTTFFPTQKLTATQKIDPSPAHLRVGDEVTRTITQTAAGTQSMLIPPVSFGDIAGLTRYPRDATTHDVVQDRAGMVAGERTDTVTYRVDRSGTYSLPAVKIEWWNTSAQRKETIALPAVTLHAVAASEKPLFAIPLDARSGSVTHRIIVIERSQVVIAALLLALGVALVWAYPRVMAFWGRARRLASDAQRRYAEGAAPAWHALRTATAEGSLKHIVPALYRWMDRSPELTHPGRLAALKEQAQADEATLGVLTDAVEQHYAGKADALPAADRSAVLRALRRLMRRVGKERKAQSPLPPLNRY
jgi:hypothetical protein